MQHCRHEISLKAKALHPVLLDGVFGVDLN
jgi:hypothetical protein